MGATQATTATVTTAALVTPLATVVIARVPAIIALREQRWLREATTVTLTPRARRELCILRWQQKNDYYFELLPLYQQYEWQQWQQQHQSPATARAASSIAIATAATAPATALATDATAPAIATTARALATAVIALRVRKQLLVATARAVAATAPVVSSYSNSPCEKFE